MIKGENFAKPFRAIRDYFAARDIPYDLIRGIITATCGVLFALLSSSYFNSVQKKRLYKQLVLNAVYDMNRTCLQAENISKQLHETDSLFSKFEVLYATDRKALAADSTSDKIAMLLTIQLHPLAYNTIEGVLREDIQAFENIDDIKLESKISDFYAVRDQFYEIFKERNGRIENIWNASLQVKGEAGDETRLSALMQLPGAIFFMKKVHPQYTKLLSIRVQSLKMQFAAILEASDISVEDLNELCIEKSGKPIVINNPYIKASAE